MSVFVGVDISKSSFSSCAIDENENTIFAQSFSMDSQGFQQFQELLSQFEPSSVYIACEASGCYHVNLVAFLATFDYHCFVLNPILVSNFSKLKLRKAKTDRIDARTIALFLAAFHDKLSPFSLSSDIRELVRERERIVCEINRIRNEIEKLVVVTFPELERSTSVFSTSILALLERFPSARAVRAASIEEIERVLSSSKGKGRNIGLTAQQIKEMADHSIASHWPHREVVLVYKIRELKFYRELLKDVEKRFEQACEEIGKQEIEILTSMDGVGKTTAMHFMAEIGEIDRFSNAKKLIAYTGLDPSVKESGRYKSKSRITKRGNRHLRRVIWLMAVSVVKWNEYFRAYFLRRIEEGLPYKKAILAVAHKLIRVIFAMLKKKERFNPKIDNVSLKGVNL